MVQTFLFVPLVWKDDALALRVRKQMDSGEPGIIDIERYRLDFHPEEKAVICGVVPGQDPWKIMPAELTYDGLRAILRKEELPEDSIRYL